MVVKPKATGVAGNSAVARSDRYTTCQRRGIGAYGSSVQRDPRYFGKAAGCASDDALTDGFKRPVKLFVGRPDEYVHDCSCGFGTNFWQLKLSKTTDLRLKNGSAGHKS